MTNREKEKFWYKVIKEAGKGHDWKFKGHFLFKQIKDFFFSANFFIDPQKNELNAWVGFKPIDIDNRFWDIIEEKRNKEMPLSFRGEAAFCVREQRISEYKIIISDALNPNDDIHELVKDIEAAVQEKRTSITSLELFVNEILQHEHQHTVGVITGLIEQGLIKNALLKISEYKRKEYRSGFSFENNRNFYDLAQEYCERNYR